MKKVISTLLLTSVIGTNISPAINVFADEILKDQVEVIEESEVSSAKISSFILKNYSNFEEYNSKFKIQRDEIKSISNNGGKYSSSSIDKAIDGDISTHWETGTQNSSTFKNEVVVEFNNIESIDRIAYATRQDGAKGKGYPTKFEIYASVSGNDEDFKLVSEGSSSSTGNMMEFQFDTINAKKIKFVFVEANQNWASASEFWFYKEDNIINRLDTIFTDDNKNKLSSDFDTLEKLEAFEQEVKNHPFYEDYKEDFNDARELLNKNEVEYTDAKVSIFKSFNDETLVEYNKLFKLNISSISTNGGHYGSSNIEKAIDGDINTSWHSGKQNSSLFTNEVILTLDKKQEINRLVYTNSVSRGFAEEFDIYVSTTAKGDTFEKVTSGSMSRTTNSMEIQFNTTEVKRIKFVFKKGYENWALAAEFTVYKEDELKDKMSRLFTDNNMSEVSEEFNTIDKIELLEEEAKVHPFYEDYKDDLNNAKEILQQSENESSIATTTSFPYGENEDYSDVFRMSYENIKSISTNGGQYSSQKIEYAIDGDLNTYWETSKSNSSTFNNEVIVEFKETTTLDRIVYGSRQNDLKGFLEEFEIYASTTTKGDTFKLVSIGSSGSSKGLTEIKFEPTKFKRVKIVFKKGTQSWATFNEIMFYSEDIVRDEVLNMFTDKTLSALKDEYNSQEAINKLQAKVDNHPAKDDLQEYLDIAKDILNNELENVKTVVAEQHGNMAKHATDNLKFGFGNNLQPTGITALPGETIVVYVDVEEGKPLPSLFFSQQEGSWASWGNTISLKAGKNVITVPKISQGYHYGYEVVSGGPVYIVNPYTEEEQGQAPIIRFASGAQQFPIFDENTDEEEFLVALKEYKAKLDADVAANPNLEDRKVIDTFEFVSDHIFFTGTATAAYEVYVEQGVSPSATVKSWNRYMDAIFEYYGLDGNNLYDDPKYIRENIRLAQPWGYMYAAGAHIGVQRDVMKTFLIPFEDRSGSNWGITHEIGHRMDVQKRLYGESTNNMLAIYMDYFYGTKPGNSIPYNLIYKNVMSENSNVYVSGNYFERIGPFWQLELYYPGYWAEFNSYYRERDKEINLESGDKLEESKTKYIVEFSSEILNMDLSEYFARQGFPVTDELREEMASKYNKPENKIWYINDTVLNYEGTGFEDGVITNVSLKKQDENIKLSFSVSDNGSEDVLGYEIIKNGEVIAFTDKEYFVDEDANLDKNETYTVIAYDKTLKTIEGVEINSYSPSISLSQDRIILKLNEEFNAEDYAKALDYNGNEIEDIKIDSNVDTNKKGDYKVTYTVISQGIEISKTMEVEVVSSYDYLSDSVWKSVETQWGTPRRNSNIKGRVNGEITNFEKGFGIHATGKIVYDLGDHNYDTFEALLGVDMGISAQDNSSITFKVVGDGETLATTKVLKHADNMISISVPVEGVKELVIEVHNGGNGNTSDHAVIANPKLSTNNTKPKLTIPSSVVTKIGEAVELDGTHSASDIEDGDLTSEVKVEGNVNFNKSGVYEITYSVTDSDGNTTSSLRKVKVVNMEDSEYLSDIDWKSASNSYTSARKNQSINGNGLRLTNEDGSSVSYEKGIGAHSTSTLTYDLTKGDYGYFTSFVGVDRNMYGTVGSVSFEVYLDNEKVYDSGVMTSKESQKFIEVNLGVAKELKLVVTDGKNGNGSDHAIWADAKLHIAKEGTALESENYKVLRELVEYADTITLDMVGDKKFTDIVWYNFNCAKDEAKEALEDSSKTEYELYSAHWFLNYTILELELIK